MTDLVTLNQPIDYTDPDKHSSLFWWRYLQAFIVAEFSQLFLATSPDFTIPPFRCGKLTFTLHRDQRAERIPAGYKHECGFCEVDGFEIYFAVRSLSFLTSKCVSFLLKSQRYVVLAPADTCATPPPPPAWAPVSGRDPRRRSRSPPKAGAAASNRPVRGPRGRSGLGCAREWRVPAADASADPPGG